MKKLFALILFFAVKSAVAREGMLETHFYLDAEVGRQFANVINSSTQKNSFFAGAVYSGRAGLLLSLGSSVGIDFSAGVRYWDLLNTYQTTSYLEKLSNQISEIKCSFDFWYFAIGGSYTQHIMHIQNASFSTAGADSEYRGSGLSAVLSTHLIHTNSFLLSINAIYDEASISPIDLKAYSGVLSLQFNPFYW